MGKSFQSKSNTLSLKGQKECMDKVFVGRNILNVLRSRETGNKPRQLLFISSFTTWLATIINSSLIPSIACFALYSSINHLQSDLRPTNKEVWRVEAIHSTTQGHLG